MTPDAVALTVVGEALVDVVHRADGSVDEAPGGSPANVALALGRLGWHPRLITALGDDDRGRRVRDWLAESGVIVEATSIPRTSTAVARLDASGSAEYEFDLDWRISAVDGAGAAASGDHPSAGGVTGGIVHVGSVAVHLEPGASAVREIVAAARSRSLITFDPNIRPSLLADHAAAEQRVEALVTQCDVVKVSDEDLRWLRPDQDPIEVASEWATRGPALVVVTAGAGGAVAVTPAGQVRAASVAVSVVDTVGAGDTFMAALIHGLLQLGVRSADQRSALATLSTADLGELLETAAAAAAITVSRPGADPPRLSELTHSLSRATSASPR